MLATCQPNVSNKSANLSVHYQEHVSHRSATYISNMSATYQPHVSHMSATYQSHVNQGCRKLVLLVPDNIFGWTKWNLDEKILDIWWHILSHSDMIIGQIVQWLLNTLSTWVLNIDKMMRIMPFCRIFDIRSMLDKSVVKNAVSDNNKKFCSPGWKTNFGMQSKNDPKKFDKLQIRPYLLTFSIQ